MRLREREREREMKSFLVMLAGSVTFVVLRMRWKKEKRRTERRIERFDDDRLRWTNGKPSKWSIDSNGTLTISPTPGLDFWSRTFYKPLLIKHDAQIFLAQTDADEEVSVTTAFTLLPRSQFDQAGIMVYVDDNCWMKAGVEYTDGHPRLSCVVTNNVRDFSFSLFCFVF